MVGAFNNAGNYVYGCGECHPTDSAFHRNGTMEVDLDPAGAPAGSLKAMNETGAAFSGNTCGSVYCHSGEQVTSSAVGDPIVSGGQYVLDSRFNLTYPPYTVNKSRLYATTPAWSGGSMTGSCTECHQFPLTTSYPSVSAGVGDSHEWVDDYGYGDLHAWNMGYNPLPCSTCHYGEITASGGWTITPSEVVIYDPVPLNDRVSHVNGQADVAFNKVDPVVYTSTFNLNDALYDPANKSCGNIACHLKQTYVTWGTPYRWWNNGECDLCHRYGSLGGLPQPPPVAIMKFSPMDAATPLPFTVNSHPVPTNNQACTDCHVKPHGK